jgi:hypothetical protein
MTAHDDRVIASDEVDHEARVETFRFRSGYRTTIIGGPFDGDYWHHSDRDEALRWHAQIVRDETR